MKFLKRLIVIPLLAAIACAQSGTVTRTSITTVTATAINGGSTMICIATNPALPALHLVCSVNGVVRLTEDVTVQVGAGVGSVGSYVEAGNTVTWQFTQPTASNFAYDVAANGVHNTGNF